MVNSINPISLAAKNQTYNVSSKIEKASFKREAFSILDAQLMKLYSAMQLVFLIDY